MVLKYSDRVDRSICGLDNMSLVIISTNGSHGLIFLGPGLFSSRIAAFLLVVVLSSIFCVGICVLRSKV